MNFCSSVFRLSELPICRERPQTRICFLEWLGRLKCLVTGLDTSLSFPSTSWRCSRNRSPSRFCFTNAYFFAINTSYAANDIGGGAGKVIIDLNRSLGSGHFLYVVNERTSFASWASALESSILLSQSWISQIILNGIWQLPAFPYGGQFTFSTQLLTLIYLL